MKKIFLFLFLIASTALLAQPVKIQQFPNGKPFREVSSLAGVKPSKLVRTYYENGSLMKEERISMGKHEGLTKIYNADGSLLKEILFRDNYVKAYTAYQGGRIETQISEDRRTVIHKGNRLAMQWGHYYEPVSARKLLRCTPKDLIDNLTAYQVPEQVTQIMNDLEDFFKSRGGKPGEDIIACGDTWDSFDDKASMNTDLRTGAGSSRFGNAKGTKTSSNTVFQQALSTQLNKCGGGGSMGGSSGRGLAKDPQRENRIKKARNLATNMLANCNTGSRNNMDLVSISSPWDADIITQEGAAIVDETIMEGELIATEGEAILDLETAAELALNPTGKVAAGFVTLEVMVAIVAVPLALVEGVKIGTEINNKYIKNRIGEAAAELKEKNDPEYQKAEAAAKKAEERRKAEDARKADEAKKQNGGTPPANPPPSNPPSTKSPANPGMPDPEGSKQSACQSLQQFVNRCEANGWKSYDCENFVRFANKCAGDVQVMMPAPDGDVWSTGCRTGGDAAAARKLECERKGMVSIPAPGGNPGGNCGTKDVSGIDKTWGISNPDAIDPVRGDFGLLGRSLANLQEIGAKDLSGVMTSTKKTFVVFMDPDCSSCQRLAQTLAAPRVKTAMSAVDIKLVDIGKNPQVLSQFNVKYVPFYFGVTNGKASEVTIGSMNETEFLRYLTTLR